eukprot:COSAG01_NODE_2840_length_6992_cov_2.267228_4_plen_232_part_00
MGDSDRTQVGGVSGPTVFTSTAAATITTTVRHVDGSSLCIRHAVGATTEQLKALIAEATGIDVAHQRLVCDGRTMGTSDTLGDGGAMAAQPSHGGQSGPTQPHSVQKATALRVRFAVPQGTALPTTARYDAHDDRGHDENGGPCGMTNTDGTNCYVNAALQSLLSVMELHTAFGHYDDGGVEDEPHASDHQRCSAQPTRSFPTHGRCPVVRLTNPRYGDGAMSRCLQRNSD